MLQQVFEPGHFGYFEVSHRVCRIVFRMQNHLLILLFFQNKYGSSHATRHAPHNRACVTGPLAMRSPSFKTVFSAINCTCYEAIVTQVSAPVTI